MLIARSKKWTLPFDETVQTIVCPPEGVHSKCLILSASGLLTMKAGWQCDRASWILTILTIGCTRKPVGKRILFAAAQHHACYELIQLGLLDSKFQDQTDDNFMCAAIAAGAPRFLAKSYRYVLRKVGDRALRKTPAKYIHIHS